MVIKNDKGWKCIQYMRFTEDGNLCEKFMYEDPNNPNLHEIECFNLTLRSRCVVSATNPNQLTLPMEEKT